MELQECLTEASGEGRCRLCDSALCTSKLCCETGQEVVLCLLRSQDGYRRKYTECICGEEDHVLSCRTCGDRANDIFNMVDRIGYTGVLGYALVSEVDHTVFIKCYVLEKSIALDRVVDIRLGFFIKVDNFSVAAALEVEYSVVVPAVLVITDQETLRICGKSCLTCSGKSEEDRCVFAFHICVSGAVHRCDAL